MVDTYSDLTFGYREIQSVSRSVLNTEKYRAEIQGSLRVYCHEALALHAKLQDASFLPEAEPWDEVSDSDSDQSDEGDEADEVLRLMV